MEKQIIKYTWNDKEVEFDLTDKNVMVNATEMAKIYDAKVENFTRTESTKSYINSFIKKRNKTPNGVLFTEKDLIISNKKSGTWMHRSLAIKFAMWLNSDFEVWVTDTIEELIFGKYKRMEESLKESAQRKKRIEELKSKLTDNPDYKELEMLAFEERQASNKWAKDKKNQLDLFMTIEEINPTNK